MKKNLYGNIEDIVVALRAVTPNGEWCSSGTYPRVSTVPDMNLVMLGSEGDVALNVGEKSTFYFSRSSHAGTLGVVTEVVVKIRPVPPVRKFASFVFPDMEYGIQFMREVAREVN